MVRLRRTCRARHRPPTHLLNRPHWAALRVTEAAPAHGFMPGHDTAPVPGVIPEGAHIHHWRLGFKQSSLGHITRALRHPALDASRRPPLPWHALAPFRFPVQVSQATQEHSSEFLPTASGIRRSASRRTPDGHVSMHPAQASPSELIVSSSSAATRRPSVRSPPKRRPTCPRVQSPPRSDRGADLTRVSAL